MAESDPRALIRNGQMASFQVAIVVLCFLLIELDGFDVLVIAYTAPSIAREWSLSPAALGVVFSGGLLGMGLGNAFVAPIADKVGRKPIAVLSLMILAIGMLVSGFAQDAAALAVTRVFTGIGIGSAVAGVNVIVAEYASDRRRGLAISLMTIGFPAGATLGGFFSIYLIGVYGWRSTYFFGAIVAVILAVPVIFWLPESIDYLISRQPTGAQARLNRILQRMGYPTLVELPESERADERQDTSLLTVFRRPYLSSTTAASIAYFATTFTVYFLLSWTPKMLTQLGFSIAGGHIGVVTDEHSRRRWMCAFRLFRQGSGPAPASCAFSCGALWHDTDVWTCIGGL
jgi:MFS family permease